MQERCSTLTGRRLIQTGIILLLALALALSACSTGSKGKDDGTVTVYSGRSESLVAPILKSFEKDTGIKVQVRYGDSAELAATILEEGKNSPADVFFAQDSGALGAVAGKGFLTKLPSGILDKVETRFRSPDSLWVGISGRARVVVYNTEKLKESDLPASILGFTDPKWKDRLGWAPTNASFQAFITGMRVKLGEEATMQWLKGIQANNPRVYPKNTPIVEAAAKGEIDAGFVNHYYLFNVRKQQGGNLAAKNYYPQGGDLGALINVAGAGILKTTARKNSAEKLIS
ncbi:MAG: iron ABC transporter substrate-binding protein, partial [Firmicutes bacterium]|nr:iron ABC transporter substrate-binding protein [Bacillota bacterium]